MKETLSSFSKKAQYVALIQHLNGYLVIPVLMGSYNRPYLFDYKHSNISSDTPIINLTNGRLYKLTKMLKLIYKADMSKEEIIELKKIYKKHFSLK